MKRIKRHPIALKLPDSVPSLILFGRHVVLVMTNNPWFPSPSPSLAAVEADLDTLEVAEATARSRTKGAAAARDIERSRVEGDLAALKAYVQSVVRQSSEKEAIAIIESAGMSPRQQTTYRKSELEVRMGPAQGEVVVRAKAVGKRSVAYEWQVAAEGQPWTTLGPTTVAKIRVPGVTVATTYLFRFRTTVSSATSDWSQTIRFLTH